MNESDWLWKNQPKFSLENFRNYNPKYQGSVKSVPALGNGKEIPDFRETLFDSASRILSRHFPFPFPMLVVYEQKAFELSGKKRVFILGRAFLRDAPIGRIARR